MNMWKTIFVVAVFICGVVHASEPRLDLYKKIKKETGVSLKEAFQAVDGKNQSAITDLQIYAKRVGIKEIEKSFDEEIVHREQYCKKKKSISCDETVQDLKSQIDFIRDLHIKSDTLDGHKKLYYSLIVYRFNIRMRVLKDDLLDWDKNCSSQEKINTKPCQEKLFEAHVLIDIARDVGQVVLTKSNKLPLDTEMVKSIKDRISRYEKL
ncbi:MAG: hypothetical protein A4S09_06240 [Proteobacteria bacterium SG_bin7]|nr:MAG: hypothetical protein A4S09_06240 [Proteobacteria bacterium SG_bin7]